MKKSTRRVRKVRIGAVVGDLEKLVSPVTIAFLAEHNEKIANCAGCGFLRLMPTSQFHCAKCIPEAQP